VIVTVYHRPSNLLLLAGAPQLASWERAGHASQQRLARFLAEVESLAAPMLAASNQPLALELVVGVRLDTALDVGGRDLDNYLFPIIQHLGASRFVAVFGRKVHGPSGLAIGPAQPDQTSPTPQFTIRLTGSYTQPLWKQNMRERLHAAGVAPTARGPLAMDIAIGTGVGRNWANLWKPLIDSLGPILGEDPARPFHPRDDRITRLGLHHHTDPGLVHDVEVTLWWAPSATDEPSTG
jgi:hypothetical protein